MDDNSLTILIPTYARTAWLQEALWCALHQTMPVPIIVLNDCPRQTLICDHPLVTVYNYERRLATLGEKRNELLRLAKTEWVCWLDDDDWLLPWYVEELHQLLESKLDAVFTTKCWHAVGGNADGSVHWKKGFVTMFMAVRLHKARESGFPDTDSAEDQIFRDRLLAKHRICSKSDLAGYCYRWDNDVYHISGKADPSNAPEFRQNADKRLDNGSEPFGRILLSPSLRHNYFSNFPGSKLAKDPASFWLIPVSAKERRTYSHSNLSLTVVFPSDIRKTIDFLFGDLPVMEEPAESPELIVSCDPGTGRYSLSAPKTEERLGILFVDLARQLLTYFLSWLTANMKTGFALSAAAIGRGDSAVILPGVAGIGKSIAMAWLLGKGFHLLSDKIVLIEDSRQPIQALRHPISIKKGHLPVLGQLVADKNIEEAIFSSPTTDLVPWRLFVDSEPPINETYPTLLLFPEFRPGADLSLQAISPAQATMLLMANVLNIRNLPLHGLPQASHFCRTLPALQLVYGDLQQLPGCLEKFLAIVLDCRFDAKKLYTLIAPLNRQRHQEELARLAGRNITATIDRIPMATPAPTHHHPIPPATPRRQNKKLTIGMATHDDYDGVYFSIQALRLYHPEVIDEIELIVIDNHPDGPCANALKKLDSCAPNYRYIPEQHIEGTAVRDVIFREASGEFILVIDSHVLIVPGAIRRLIQYFTDHPKCRDLLQGPLMHDDLRSIATNFEAIWRAGMFGIWQTDERGLDEDGEAFEISAQGLGLFCCRKDCWPGFNPRFRGFGGEEGYIHEKFRKTGGKTLCLPFLRWLHRFNRPMGIPYKVSWQDRIFNYLVGLHEFDLDSSACKNHFIDHLGEKAARQYIAEAERQIQSPFHYFDAIYCQAASRETEGFAITSKSLDVFGAGQGLRVFSVEGCPDDPVHRRLLCLRLLIEKVQKLAYRHLLVIEEGFTFIEDTADRLAKLLQQLDKKNWQVFLLEGNHDEVTKASGIFNPPNLIQPQRPGKVRAVAYHQRAYESLLANLPQDDAAIPSWLERFKSLENFLSTYPATYLASPSLVAATE